MNKTDIAAADRVLKAACKKAVVLIRVEEREYAEVLLMNAVRAADLLLEEELQP